ncbi:uncharacterized protein LACBIDRAFT_294403 [Laccaria bicolor S238N-H82]|uniref:Predicted protein n=1 Tax=Laccaria bicolor (strain S238N-H82 / ATCC MYA-4686) TaxID=486041 RepID=B0DAT1_LACBS|nr:uncharacterized protein LACBIDRAFT_294403 [Laccaria bicolor S238N-H82]EDR08081.1 predicted protein [Laccaria bicolor S238N-H82]|eukprot:XP_001881151.1 predicted protein [Laccaria bicolor S238N-H82]
MPTAGGSKVAWKKGANGDAEHVIEPGSHIKPVLNQMGIKKGSPFHKDLKAALNHKDNLSVLHPGANKAKAQLTADPRRNPKNKAAANHYMQQHPIQHKASATMNRIESAAKKHRIKNFVAKVKANVKKVFPNVRRSELDE